MACLYWRTDRKRWEVIYFKGGKRLRANAGNDRKVALAIKNKIENDLLLQGQGLKEEKEPERSLGELVGEYLQAKRGVLRPKTFATTKRSCERFLSFLGSATHISKITALDIERFTSHLRGLATTQVQKRKAGETIRVRRITSESTAARILIPIANMFCLAVDWGWLGKNPLRQYKNRPRIRWASKTKDFLTAAEVKHLLEAAREQQTITVKRTRQGNYETTLKPHPMLYPLLLIMVRMGLRKAEACTLRWEDIDFTGNLLYLRDKTLANGTAWEPKGRKDVILPLDAKVKAAMLLLPRPCEWVFASEDGGCILESAQAILARFKKHLPKKLRRVTFHLLRHTFASHMVCSGVALAKVQKWLGHSDPRVTQIYAHLQPSDLAAELDKLPY